MIRFEVLPEENRDGREEEGDGDDRDGAHRAGSCRMRGWEEAALSREGKARRQLAVVHLGRSPSEEETQAGETVVHLGRSPSEEETQAGETWQR